MKNAILLHGRPGREEYYDGNQPSASNAHWFPWLQKQLLAHDIKADTPEVPLAFDPQWDLWVREVERFEIGLETILIGHSTGGGFFVKYLSLHPELNVNKLVLVAPWINSQHEEDIDFFDCEIDSNLAQRCKEFIIFNSDNDHEPIQNSVAFLRSKIPGVVAKDFHNYGHFCYEDLKTDAFPELLEEILKA